MSRAKRPSKDLMTQARQVCGALKRAYPEATCALTHADPYQLLVATILSAQCTDARVNMVTPELFRRFPDAASLARAVPGELEALIRSTGFFRAKARNLLAMANQVVERHDGEIPRDLDALTALAGVGRKTANVVLGTAFGIASGNRGRYARQAARSTAGTDIAQHARADRTRSDAGDSSRAMGRSQPSPDPARPARLPGSPPAMRRLLLASICPKIGVTDAAKVARPRPIAASRSAVSDRSDPSPR